jgi:hypothetical protein
MFRVVDRFLQVAGDVALKNGASSGPACGQVLFPDPSLYVAINHEPRPDDPDWVNVLCEGSADEKAIRAYLSPFDALLDAAYSSKPGKPYHVVPAYQFVPTAFVDDHNGRLALDIHLGWPACDGALISRRNGSPAAWCAYQERHVDPEEGNNIAFSVDRETLEAIDRLSEHAGPSTK